jgi:hypothetical protein
MYKNKYYGVFAVLGAVALDCWAIGARHFEAVWVFRLQGSKSPACRLET